MLRYKTSKFIIDNKDKFDCPSTENLIEDFYIVTLTDKGVSVKFWNTYNINDNDKKLIVDFVTENCNENLV